MLQPEFNAPPQRVDIQLGDRSYPILIAADLLGDPAHFAALPPATTALI
ncbi:MAG: 3-dehydroquinate synthase, partial [Comamonadaceae bacterium]